MDRRAQNKSLAASTVITLLVVAMLVFSGPAQAVSVIISGLLPSYIQSSGVEFQVKIEINDADKFVPVTNISLDIAGPDNTQKNRVFALNGTPISGDSIIDIKPVSVPQAGHFGYGYGYGYDSRLGQRFNFGYGYGYGYGHGYGYGYGSGSGSLTYVYNVTINTTSLPVGSYAAVASLNTGNAVKPAFTSESVQFKILPVIEILDDKINPGSNEEIKVAILSSAGFNASQEVNISSIRFGHLEPPNKMGAAPKQPFNVSTDVNNDKYSDLLLHFKAKDTGIECSDKEATLTGKTYDGRDIIGTDSIITLGCEPPASGGGGSNSKGGGSSGGGSGPSGEKHDNIELKETYDLHIYKGRVTSYKFKAAGNPISYVNIEGRTNAGEIAVTVEVLKDTSSLVKKQAPGTVYKNVDLWVGTFGFANAKNIENAVVGFKVKDSWLVDNHFKSGEVKMVRWNGTDWEQLKTEVKATDGTYTSYEATSRQFSPVAIIRLKDDAAPAEVITPFEENPLSAGETGAAVPEAAKGMLIRFVVVSLVGLSIFAAVLLSVLLIRGRRRRPELSPYSRTL